MQQTHTSQVPSYREGTWFAVPLRSGGFGLGMVARLKADSHGGVGIGFFFGPRFDELPQLRELEALRAHDALLVCRFGVLGLADQTWPILGVNPAWTREAWPAPTFGRTNPLSGRVYRIRYAEDDIQRVIAEEPVESSALAEMPRDGLLGAGAVEIVLSKAIDEMEKGGVAGGDVHDK
jgi:hypothetical protein